MEKAVASKRILKWDNIKFVMIFFVVVGHICDVFTSEYEVFRSLYLWIYIFHMPAFMLVSGILSRKTIEGKKYKNIFSYLILYFVIKFLRNGILYLINGEGNVSLLSENGVAWYAGALFTYCIIMVLLYKIDIKYIFVCSIILSCIAGYDKSIGDWLILSRLIVFFPFFLVGYAIDIERLMQFSQKALARITGTVIIFVSFIVVMCYRDALYWLRPLITGKNPFSTLDIFGEIGGVLRFIYYIVAFAITFSFVVIIPNVKIPFITKLGQRTLSIYTLHYSFIDILFVGLGIGAVVVCENDFLSCINVVIIALLIVLVTSMSFFHKAITYIITPKMRASGKFV